MEDTAGTVMVATTAGKENDMQEPASAYGLWSLVIINSLVFIIFAFSFAKPQTNRDWRDVMKDFNRGACPDPGEYDNERISVEDHIAKFVMHNYQVGPASVRFAFGGRCEVNVAGDACVSVPVFWDSTGPNGRGTTRGTDYLTGVYVAADSRWWLCSSRYIADTTFGHRFYSSK